MKQLQLGVIPDSLHRALLICIGGPSAMAKGRHETVGMSRPYSTSVRSDAGLYSLLESWYPNQFFPVL